MTDHASRLPGDDKPVASGDTVTIVNAIKAYKSEAQMAKRTRMIRNRENRAAYLGVQDWSHKTKGQSREFLPKIPVAVEQFVAFAKRALTQFGAYYDVELGRDSQSPVAGEQIRALLDCFLNDLLVEDNVMSSFPILIGNALKIGALESLVVLKVHGNMVNDRVFTLEPGDRTINQEGSLEEKGENPKLVLKDRKVWKLRIDLVKNEDWLPDPTGAGLYEIHSAERDLSYVMKRAEEGVYSKAAVNRLVENHPDFRKDISLSRRARDAGQDEPIKPGFRKKVLIDEFWGTILDDKGKIVHENVFCTIGNNEFVLRQPKPNPFWHQESPFVSVPLIRVPFSVWHKALFDHAAQINFAMNEMFNLIIDGGISSVWGIKQLRVDDLEDPRVVTGGIPQGETLIVKSTLPHGQKVLETVSEGTVPTDAMLVLEMLSREFAAAALSNELKLGAFPAKQVKATEVVELSQSQAATLDSITADVERELIGKVLRKSWLTMLQNIDDVSSDKIINAIGIKATFRLSRMNPAERFAAFANTCSFKVHGLSAVLSKVRDFQKLMALLQAVSTNPILLQAFFKKYSPDKILSHLMKTLGVNPEQMERDEEELARLQQDIQELPAFQQLTGGGSGKGGGSAGAGGGGGAGLSAQNVGEPGLPAEINAIGNASSGLAGAGGA